MRRTSSPVFLLAGLCLGGALFIAGCRQGEGDRCEVMSDCQTGLSCVGAMSGMGTCCAPGSPACSGPAPRLDAAVSTLMDAAAAVTEVGVSGDASAEAAVDAAVDGALDAATDGASDGPGDAGTDLAPLDGAATH